MSLPRTASSLPDDSAGYSTGCWCTEHERHDSGAQSLEEVDGGEDTDAACVAAIAAVAADVPMTVSVVRSDL